MGNWRYMRAMTRALLAAGLPWLVGVALAGTPAQAVTARELPLAATVAAPDLTLEQAVAEVQDKTHGKVLRAGSRQYGNTIEYRIKVLTPDGHVRVIPVRSRQTRNPEHEPEETH